MKLYCWFTTTYKSLLIFRLHFVVCPTFSEKNSSFTGFSLCPKKQSDIEQCFYLFFYREIESLSDEEIKFCHYIVSYLKLSELSHKVSK